MHETPRDLSLLHRELGRTHRGCHQKTAGQLGLYYGQPILLLHIYENHGISQKELADRMHNTPASIAVSVKRMEKSGWVKKQTNQTDMRCNTLQLTQKGQELALRCRTGMHEIDQAMYDGFSQAEREQLAGFYRRMIENLKGRESREQEEFQ